MQTYELLVRNRAVIANSPDMTMVRTSVGIDQVHVLFDNAEWLDFPVTITFAQGEDVVTQSLAVTEIDGGEWVAEAAVVVPYEVIDMVGSVRVTFQGTDAEGRHIITAKGSPLSVEESGDVVTGEPPSDAPTVDEWNQAYANAVAAANAAQSAASMLESRADEMIEGLRQSILAEVAEALNIPIATTESAGIVQVGSGLSVTNDGMISVTSSGSSSGLSPSQESSLANLVLLASACFNTQFDTDGVFQSATVRPGVLPYATPDTLGGIRYDGETLVTDGGGVLSAVQYQLPTASKDTLGGVKIDEETLGFVSGKLTARVAGVGEPGIVKPDGTTIIVTPDGTITSNLTGDSAYTLPMASENQLGGVRVDGETISVDENGVISVSIASVDDLVF